MKLMDTMGGRDEGARLLGAEPRGGRPNSLKIREALGKLEGGSSRSISGRHETAIFWKRPGVTRQGHPDRGVHAAGRLRGREGRVSISNSGRWAQWRYKAVEADRRQPERPLDHRRFAKAMKKAYAKDGVFPEPITKLAWNYGGDEPEVHLVAKEINGTFTWLTSTGQDG